MCVIPYLTSLPPSYPSFLWPVLLASFYHRFPSLGLGSCLFSLFPPSFPAVPHYPRLALSFLDLR